jgi:prephenate dehydrogenase
MGGAAGLAARRTGAALQVVGVANRSETIEKARRLGAVDEATLDLAAGVRDADLVLIAVPLRAVVEVARGLLPHCRQGAVITDVSSCKARIVPAIENLISRRRDAAHFVGSHPLAGSEKSGLDAAPEVQLAGALCLLTPSADGEAYQTVDGFWKALGMKTLRISPEEHDAHLARSSHLPHLVAFALIAAQTERSLSLSGSGLRDMTRLAGSDVRLWSEVFAANAAHVSRAARELGEELVRLSQEVQALGFPDAETARERLFRYLADAKQRHEARFPSVESGAEPSPPPPPPAIPPA